MMKTIDIEEFRGYLAVDKANLDEDLCRQSSLFFEVGEAFTDACAERDTAKDDLNVISAELYREMRKKLERKADGNRITEEMVRTEVLSHRDHEDAMLRFLDTQRDAMLLEHLKDAFRQRSYILKDLAQLAVANFFERDSVRVMDDSARSIKFQSSKKAIAEDRKKPRGRNRVRK